MRLPRPRPYQDPPPNQVPGELCEDQCQGEAGYTTCDEGSSAIYSQGLLAAAHQIAGRLASEGDVEAVDLIQALSLRLEWREKHQVQLKTRYRAVKARDRDQHDLRGEKARYWWKIKHLQRKLQGAELARSRLQHRNEWLMRELQQQHPP